jgi:hypothetical protein
MTPPFDVTGRWSGYYLQRGEEHPISADLVQKGSRLSGSMRDGAPDSDLSVFEAALEAGLPPGADEEIEAKLREAVPGAGAGPIRYVSHLPSDSRLSGRCHDRTVSFLKTYQGVSFGGYKVGDQLLGVEKAGHAVHYEGQLSLDGQVIDGRWWIGANREAGTPRAEGLFTLHRQARPDLLAEEQGAAVEEEQRPWWKFWARR